MNKPIKLRSPVVSVLLLAVVASGCSAAEIKPLKELYRHDFLIGNVLAGGIHGRSPYRKDSRELDVLRREFNCLTAENSTKMEFLQPTEGSFDFKATDAFVDFAEKNNMTVVGHVLVWHAMAPDWLFVDDEGLDVTREVLIERMRTHIHTVVSRYKGRIDYWDVVNEAVDTKMVDDPDAPLKEDGTRPKKHIAFMRKSKWLRIIGEDFIELAFRFAHEADPDAKLIYNDYSMNDKAKVEFVAGMVRELKAKKVPIDGVGMQGHWHLEYPTPEELNDSIRTLAETGVKIHISELDLKVLPRAHGYAGADVEKRLEMKKELDPYVDRIPAEVLQQQADKYREIFEVLLANRKYIERVSFWGVSDKYSWLNDHPVRGRTAYPLLFDRNFNPKPAYTALQELKNEKQ